ncbi:MAG TPA: SMC-Scp complex subunit ScpB [Acidimicrobiia bacterium]|nr:SMC-Scp complex subunit ScpB [Acidimicrobiia bacterium]HZQ80030.1 SMC-Scp complex subunit ScpB [Acidimicrobiia bacterium]
MTPDDARDDDDWEYPAPEGPLTAEQPEEPPEARQPAPPPQPIPPEAPREPDEWRRAIEAVLMAATEPVEPQVLAQLIERPVAEVEGLCALLAAEFTGRGFVLVKVAGGYRFQTHPDCAPYVERYLLEGRHARLSGAALETLAVIAYKQPVTRSQLSAVRGVDVDGVVRSLLDRGYIEEVGRTDGVGHPVQYGTTRLFLERLGLESLEKLPALADLVPDPGVMEELEARLAETSRAGVRFDPVRRRRPAAARPGEGQATLGDIDPAWDAPAD